MPDKKQPKNMTSEIRVMCQSWWPKVESVIFEFGFVSELWFSESESETEERGLVWLSGKGKVGG